LALPAALAASPFSTLPPTLYVLFNPLQSSPGSSSFVYHDVCSDRVFVLFSCSAMQGEGDWAVTSVLHDATSVVTLFPPCCLVFRLPAQDLCCLQYDGKYFVDNLCAYFLFFLLPVLLL
jgi:hypothetical protein